MMRIIKKASIVLFFIMAFVSLRAEAATELGKFDWNPVMDAIIKVESRGNARAVNGRYVGVLQISPILVRECNNILKSRGQRKRFSLADRFSPSKSREMFVLIQSVHNPSNSIEKAIRLWSGGIRYSVSKTQRYLRTVMSHM
ncbi:lysozyme family protein [Prevotella corporis]|uniref:hypothetical protein n=1 Tax=Prevotella corporis TaxID=28128 RepID=UPI0003F5574A|nr:hypothetical protein [Prevotella corporis]